ncbi:uncharacterized protein BDV17DRAFT_285611 [Aspergillus undulatus]|uniref:uncharacterized protein n=1 Tax=Aspergillus undulatus TaxID=1810928 RepID=UPI003CCD3396
MIHSALSTHISEDPSNRTAFTHLRSTLNASCGVLISHTSAAPGTLPTAKIEWHQNLRTDYRSSYKDSDAHLVSYIPFYDPEHGSWCFSFHALYTSVPVHDYGGAAQFQKPVGDPIRNMTESGVGHFVACPSQFHDVSEILSSLSQNIPPLPRRPPARLTVQSPSAANDIFSSHPGDVLYMRFSLLSSNDVQRLRLSSRHLRAPKKHRRRIWDLARINAALLAHHTAGSGLSGSFCSENTQKLAPVETIIDDKSPGAVISAQLFDGQFNLLRSGSRRLLDSAINLPLNDCEIAKIRIFTVSFKSQEFNLGLQSQLTNRHSIDVARPACVTGLELAVRVDGITGARVIVDADSTYSSTLPQLVGDKGTGEPDIAFGKLRLGQSARQIRLVARFDASTMTSLGIIEDSGLVLGTTDNPTYLDTCSPKRDGFLRPQPQYPKFQDFNPTLNLDFGGADSERLPKLTRIVAHARNFLAPFIKITSFIDGPGGELISSVTVEKSAKTGRILSYQFRTNLRNEYTFSQRELKSFQVTEHLPRFGPNSSPPNPSIKKRKRPFRLWELPLDSS